MATQAEKTTEALRERILNGEILPGTELQEKDLCVMFQISRTPVRSALHTLAKEGIIEYKPNIGYRVKIYDNHEIAEAYELRATLEGMGCRLVAERGLSINAKQHLGETLDRQYVLLNDNDADTFDADTWRGLNEDFHTVILKESGNKLLENTVMEIQRMPLATLRTIPYWHNEKYMEMTRHSYIDHYYIFDALKRQQAFRAEARMREHIQIAGQLVQEQHRLWVQDSLNKPSSVIAK